MDTLSYSVLIRTFNCTNLLPATLEALARQTASPSEYVFVDSGSTDGTLERLPNNSIIHKYRGGRFNYAAALNQGLEYVSTEYVLIISSHTTLSNLRAVEFALRLLEENENVGAAYVGGDNSGALRYDYITANTFTGFNGLWNTCALIKTPLLRERGFRPEVFSAEDQEWARWLLCDKEGTIARLAGAGMVNNNPRKYSLKKRLNEYVSVAYFTNRALLNWRNLARIGLGIVRTGRWPATRERIFNLVLLCRLIGCYVSKPKAQSRYF